MEVRTYFPMVTGYLSFIGIVLLTLNIWNNKLFFPHEFTDHLLEHCEFIIFEANIYCEERQSRLLFHG